jgi:hypothetical protein
LIDIASGRCCGMEMNVEKYKVRESEGREFSYRLWQIRNSCRRWNILTVCVA